MRLVFETGALAGHGVELPPGVTLVGRADDCDLVVPGSGVSGDHAELTVWPKRPGDRARPRVAQRLGDGVDAPVRHRIRRPDDSALRVTLTY